MCICCFLKNDYQSKMRKLAQVRNDRFENTLRTYKKDFIEKLKKELESGACSNCTGNNSSYRKFIKDLSKDISKLLKIYKSKAKSSLDIFFDNIITAYECWIKQDVPQALKLVKYCLEQGNFQDPHSIYNIKIPVFFRARKSDTLLSKEEMYHIPYNKRYLVGNQRYSVSGIPALYFGLTIPVILSEMRTGFEKEDYEHYIFSYYNLKFGEKLKIFDFRNYFPSYLENIKALKSEGLAIKYGDKKFHPNKEYLKSAFYLFILNSCCSFNRRDRSEGQAFAEEYVLPQLVTQIIYETKFEGITFESTRVNEKNLKSEDEFGQTEYKLNIALFTKYNNKSNFDDTLLNKFYISEPQKIDSMLEISDTEMQDLSKEILEKLKSNHRANLQDLIKYTSVSDAQLEKVLVNDKHYFDHPLGKFHKYLRYCSLLDIRNSI